MSISKETKINVIKNYANHSNDTGSTVVQVAILTTRINSLIEHFKIHKKDNHSRRGLLAMVSKRKKLLSYLKKNNLDEYKNILNKLNLRGVK